MNITDPISTITRERLAIKALNTRLPLAAAQQLAGEFYASPEIANLEKDRIFMRAWLCVGREEHIPHAGDYFSSEITSEPFVVARSHDGKIHAFVNMCLHRGVPVAEGAGNKRLFVCPYHAWSYELNGQLKAAPHMSKSHMLDAGHYRLTPLAVEIWRGWIFINFDPQPEPFEQFIDQYERELWWFRTEQCRSTPKAVLRINCNWKLVVENLIDIYHGPVVHKQSFGGFLKTKPEDIEFTLLGRGGWIFEQESRPLSAGGDQLFTTLPWLEGRGAGTSYKGGIFPNLNLSLRLDSLRMWHIWPTSVNTSEVHLYSLFAEKSFQDTEFQDKVKRYEQFVLNAIADEDGPMVASLQKTVSSRFYKPGHMSHMEGAVHHIMNCYLDEMQL